MSQQATAVAQPQKITAPTATNKQTERLLRRKCACGGSAGLTGACKECDENRLRVQRRALGPAQPLFSTHVVDDVLAEEGQELDESTRTFMESQLGHDFTRVRVHTNARAADSARAVNALAYTVGSDVVFASGQFQPHTTAGRHLIVHELVHTVQQREQPPGGQAKLEIGEEGDELEREADRLADQVMRRGFSFAAPPPAPPQLPASSVGPLVQRTPDDAASVQTEPDTAAAPNVGLIVEDDAGELGPGQMRKSQFLDQLRVAACAAADAELRRVGRSTEACPYIARAFERYRTFTSQRLERGLRRYAPEAAGATSAQQYIDAVGARVGRAVGVWATTGEITDVPDELQGEFGVMGFFGGLGGLFSGIGSVVGGLFGGIGRALGGLFFKARAGGARDEDADAGEVKAQLGTGETLEPTVRNRMEGAFGHDFSRVRVHASADAATLTSNLNARAFTVGTDIGFAAGEYKPGTLIGDALIAHELAHVVQQGDSTKTDAAPLMKGDAANSDVLEDDADESAVSAVASIWGGVKHGLTKISRQAMPRLKSGLQLQRCSHDYEIRGVSTDEATDSIFFDRRNANIEDSQKPKIEALKEPTDRRLRLYAFVSEDENIPPAAGRETAQARFDRVNEALRHGPNAHTGDQLAGDAAHPDGLDLTSGRGHIDYRDMRKVKVVPATETSSGERDCSGGGEVTCTDENEAKFTSAQAKAPDLLDPAIAALSSPLSESANTLLDTFFHTSDDATRTQAASIVVHNLTKVKDHIATQMTPTGTKGSSTVARAPGHICVNDCDPKCGPTSVAYNSGTDDDALMALCDTGTDSAFMSDANDDSDRALTLIHEGLHGITINLHPSAPAGPSGAKDLSYRWQRVMRFIDTPSALRNNDSYVLFVSAVNGLDTSSGADIPDDPEGGVQASRAVAFVEGWLIWADQQLRALYSTINDSRADGAWNNPFYEELMGRIAHLFDMTQPPALPTERDQTKVAAISDRIARLRRIPNRSVEMRRPTHGSTHWEEGPHGPLTLGEDFYSFPPDGTRNRKQVELVLRKLLDAAPDIGMQDEYMQMIEQVRQQRGGLAP